MVRGDVFGVVGFIVCKLRKGGEEAGGWEWVWRGCIVCNFAAFRLCCHCTHTHTHTPSILARMPHLPTIARTLPCYIHPRYGNLYAHLLTIAHTLPQQRSPQVEKISFDRYGGEEGLDAEIDRRENTKTKRKQEKYEKKVKGRFGTPPPHSLPPPPSPAFSHMPCL